MMSLVRSRFVKVVVPCIAALVLLQACEKAAEEEVDEGSEDGTTPTITLSGTYYTPCVAIPGMVIGGATHSRTQLRFGVGTADGFEYTTFYNEDSACGSSDNAYAINQQGTFSVGSATTSPTGGYGITFTVTEANILLYTSTAKDDFTSGCPSHGPYSAAPSVRPVYGAVACANIDIEAPGSALYNTLVNSDPNLTMGTATGKNPGVATQGAVSASQTLSFAK